MIVLILGPDMVQVILEDQRSISEMRFRLPTSLRAGITFTHYDIQAPGSFALMLENHLHSILLLTIDHHGSGWSLLPFELPKLMKPFQVQYMEDRIH